MKIVFNDLNSNVQETISIENFNSIEKSLQNLSSKKGTLKARIFVINESISSPQLSKLKNIFDKFNIISIQIFSNNRDTILAGKSLKIVSNFVREQELKNKLRLLSSNQKDDILHKGTVRSGDRISSNGNLCIIGDVNPGAIVTAKKNIYVWGKLLGIAFAGKGGDKNTSISSLYLNPLQLRIADVIAIGPNNKPTNYYPEIAVIDNQTITINPYIIETNN